MEYTVIINGTKGVTNVKVAQGTNLLQFLRQQKIDVSAPCGGNGRCGKCKIKVSGINAEPSDKEADLLGEKALEDGYRLACYQVINNDLEIFLEETPVQAEIMTFAKERKTEFMPSIQKIHVLLPEPDIHDQTADLERIARALGNCGINSSIKLIRQLPQIVREQNLSVTAICMDGAIQCVEAGDTTKNFFGIGVDIGTTTIAAYLYDMNNGKKMGIQSMLNPQKRFGADVISRIDYTINYPNGLDDVNQTIITSINSMTAELCKKNGLKVQDVYEVVFVGNTTMMHFLLKADAKNIAVSPFVPVTTSIHKLLASELGLEINEYGRAIIFPCVSGYIGADTVAATLSCGMYEKDEISLMIDIGTNGEMVLGNKEWLYSCSTAAGPAFEGANIRNGVGGIKGAIDKVFFNDTLTYTTIADSKAIGLCGSGIVDVVAGMVEKDVIDETGRIADEDEREALNPEFANRIVEIDGKFAFLVSKADENAAGLDIAITQKDIRELQNAKAAIAAGIKTMVKRAGISMNEINRVFLAGGFGNYINTESALGIGLLPRELRGKIESIGNAAGAGAVEGLLSSQRLADACKIKEKIKYIELSASPDFVDEYVECMMFEKE